ncbi:uncharacterized protein LACBIDRAFT_314025 [Laccaria bicolor S238N-H82]|uniref:Predicted protein n=1 Tax=Laccaria bicolor (strain S238N-H82 / ATCC MYA-4686) TaxID=486041 RepID=B0D1E8_LACBS|nr:uncharacterized protein LACBIDRAFT_314025 [Laccaria bicolor S238N-H82]EDR11623.1 predicted protein [Laccaria bicolor S238N-H82]|eukprot:XP_001877520.1 predicted protein [Laccaria bicolor S238N-H82]
MAFLLSQSRPSSPSPRGSIYHEDDAAGPRPAASSTYYDAHEMARESAKPYLDIILDSPFLILRGLGPDVESTRLSGNVLLFLTEPTSVKEITLQFKGKARLPTSASESLLNNAATTSYTVCTHDWSFLEGERKHSHTLKAGRHLFPFQLEIGGSLPSSIATHGFGGASVSYKLRAIASRSGLTSSRLQAFMPVVIMRSFAHGALEYQQTLEIENSWPEKLMYSILLPHKAWAAGDKLSALVKFSPLSKGTSVSHLTTSIHETTKIFARSGPLESTRTITTTRHDIVNGKAVEVPIDRPRSTYGRSRSNTASGSGTPMTPLSVEASRQSPMTPATHLPPISEPSLSSSNDVSQSSQSQEDEDLLVENHDIVTLISVALPTTLTPSHAVEPINITHRVRWSIFILNPDGHTSELRCSLPLYVLDNNLLEEAHAFSAATRRLVLSVLTANDPDEEGVAHRVSELEDEDRELPSYNMHIRDRVANMFLPEGQVLRVTNPWVTHHTSPTVAPGAEAPHEIYMYSDPQPRRSGYSSPALDSERFSQLPHAPTSRDRTTLDWVNSELLLSLSDTPPRRAEHEIESTHTSPEEDRSRSHSRWSSRPHSRAPSPERTTTVHHGNGSGSGATSPAGLSPGFGASMERQQSESFMQTSRNLQSLLKATMKPFTSLGGGHQQSHHHHGPFTRSFHSHMHHSVHSSQFNTLQHPHPSSSSSAIPPLNPIPSYERTSGGPQRVNTVQHADPANSGPSLLHRAFTEVPDYSIAARGFLGGVPPLTSMRGLPSYEESELRIGEGGEGMRGRTSASDSNLVGRFERGVVISREEGEEEGEEVVRGVQSRSRIAMDLEGVNYCSSRGQYHTRERSGLNGSSTVLGS